MPRPTKQQLLEQQVRAAVGFVPKSLPPPPNPALAARLKQLREEQGPLSEADWAAVKEVAQRAGKTSHNASSIRKTRSATSSAETNMKAAKTRAKNKAVS